MTQWALSIPTKGKNGSYLIVAKAIPIANFTIKQLALILDTFYLLAIILDTYYTEDLVKE